MGKPGNLWIGSVVIDCKKFDDMIAFWKAALGYESRHLPSEDWALIYDPRGSGPNLAFQKDPEGPRETYWFRLDLYSSEPKEEVNRLLKLGATMVQPAREGFDYVTLADPDGNPFDVVEARAFKFGQPYGRRVPNKVPCRQYPGEILMPRRIKGILVLRRNAWAGIRGQACPLSRELRILLVREPGFLLVPAKSPTRTQPGNEEQELLSAVFPCVMSVTGTILSDFGIGGALP